MGKPETQEEKYKTMTEKPVSSLICRLAVPTIISMLVTSFYNMADTFFVARIGTSATAAVGVSFALMAIIQAFGFSAVMARAIIFHAKWGSTALTKRSRWRRPASLRRWRWAR